MGRAGTGRDALIAKEGSLGPLWVTEVLPTPNGTRLNIPQVFPTAVLPAALMRLNSERAYSLESRKGWASFTYWPRIKDLK